MSAQDLIVNLQKLDIELWVENDKLRYSAPPDVMTDAHLQQLVENKKDIVEWLQRAQHLQQTKLEPIETVSRDQSQLASFAQQRMLFVETLIPGTDSYNVSFPLRIVGDLDEEALQKSFDSIIDRHESLRTRFDNRGGDYLQVIEPSFAMPLTRHSLRDCKKKERTEKLNQIILEERRLPFDLHTGPVIRATLVDFSESESILIVSIHHIVSDGWSLGVLFGELDRFYTAYSTGVEPIIPALQIQYVDYAVWQRQSLSDGMLQHQASYWKEKLEGFAQLQLPTDFKRPQLQTFDGGQVSRLLPGQLTASIKRLSEAADATLFITMLAAFKLLLKRYCLQDDIVIGTPIANRNRVEVEELIGFFVNMLVLRTDLSGASSFNSLLMLVKSTALEAYQNQDLPFEKLVEELNIERDLSRNPLFQVSFALQGTPEGIFQLDGLDIAMLQVAEATTTRFDLEVNVTEGRGQMKIDCLYNTQLFERNTIEIMMQRFEALLQTIVGNPDQCLERLDILTDAERQKVLHDWNQTATDYPREKTVAWLFEEQVRATPQAIAVCFDDQSLSYEELNRRANQLAHYLIDSGVSAEVVVGLCLERGLDLIISILAITKAGGVYLPLDADYPAQRLAFMLGDASAGILLTQSGLADRFSEFDGRRICVDRQWPEIEERQASDPDVKLNARNLIYVMYTSGSTGQPKGVCIEHRSVVRLVKSTNYFKPGPAETFLLSAPVSFDASTLEIWGSLLNGARLIVYPEQKISLDRLGRVLEKNAVTTLWLTSALFSQMVDQQLESLQGVTTLLAGGEALSITHVKKYLAFIRQQSPSGHRLVNGYGPTENTTFSCCYVMDGETGIGNTVPIGRPISNTRVYILDENQNPVPPGITGELYISGDGLARGYLNRPELSAEKFVTRDIGTGKELRLYRTGDLVRYRDVGDIIFIGRVDSQIKLRGYRIEPGEIEVLLNEHEAVSEALVLLRADNADDRRLVAYLVLETDAGDALPAIREYCRQNLPTYMLPSAFVLLPQFPVTANGKIDRKRLPAPSGERQVNTSFVAANGQLERAIAEIWKALLGLDAVGVRDNFFDLGGHSILLIKLQGRLQDELDVDISVIDLFRYTTIEALARYLDGNLATQSTAAQFELRQQRRRQSRLADDTIAVVGMAGRFPGAPDLGSFWKNLVDGVESIRFFTEEELRAAGIPEQLIQNPAFVPARGYLDGAEYFDASFFGYSASEAELIDPQQRVFLETTVHALEHAGCDPQTYEGMIAVFAGTSANTYLDNIRTRPDILSSAGMQVFISSEKDFVATRVCYKLGLKGPGLTIQTACSTSLVAIHEACRSLQDFDCDVALAGGVSLSVPRINGYIYQQDSILSPDGHCRTFDANANGTVSGEGVGVVVLKRLADAIADRDTIHAVVKGSAINNDGADKAGYTAPGIQGQANVIEMAQASANVSSADIGYVETHGTATSLGDPIEVSALTQAFRHSAADNFANKHCALGAVKQNLGHLDSAAGVASFIKTVLVIEHAKIPPAPHFTSPNPQIDFENSPFFVNTEIADWPLDSPQPRRAGVSSFGIGGTNAHVILEQAPVPEADNFPAELSGPGSEKIFVISAKTASALQQSISRLADYLQRNPQSRPKDIAFTLQTGRTMYRHRAMLVGDRIDVVAQKLQDGNPEYLFTGAREAGPKKPVFMFSGQGSQYAGMAQDLYLHFPDFRDSVDSCCEILRPQLERDLRELLFPADQQKTAADKLLSQTQYAQCSLFVIEYAIAKLWMRWGVEPAALIGHSVGEYVAACLSGVFSLADALTLVARRGRLMQAQPPGAMLSVFLGSEELAAHVPAELLAKIAIATINTPSNCVVAGEQDDIQLLLESLQQQEIDARLLPTSHAFHSAMMDGALEPFVKIFDNIALHEPLIPFISNVTGSWIEPEQATSPQYWAQHLRNTVLFSAGLKTLLDENFNCFIEMGPGNTLAAFVRQQPDFAASAADISVLSSLRHPRQTLIDTAFIMTSLGRTWLAGQPLDWSMVNGPTQARRIPLPVYPFERKRFWVDPRAPQSASPGPLARQAGSRLSDTSQWAYIPSWKATQMLVEAGSTEMPGDWLVFANDSINCQALMAHIQQQGGQVISVTTGEDFAATSPSSYRINPSRKEDYEQLFTDSRVSPGQLKGIFHCWGLRPENSCDAGHAKEVMRLEFYSLLYIGQALMNSGKNPLIHIDVLTQFSQMVDRDDLIMPEKSMVAALLRVISQENIGFKFTLYDLSEGDLAVSAKSDRVPVELLSIVDLSRKQTDNRVIAFRRQRRWLQIFDQVSLNPTASRQVPAHLRKQGVYLITGGLGGVGFVMANYLAREVDARLVLTSRTSLPEPAKWNAYLEEFDNSDKARRIIAQLRYLESLGAEVLVKAVDTNDATGMQALVDDAEARFGPIHGVIHAAGVVSGDSMRSMQSLSFEDCERQFDAKVYGLRLLQQLFEKYPLDFVMPVSSLSAVLGGLGFAAYSAANQFMDSLSQQQSERSDTCWISVNWDGWLFDEIGDDGVPLSGTPGSVPGAFYMTAAEGGIVFGEILNSPPMPQLVISTGDLDQRLQQWVYALPGESTAVDSDDNRYERPELSSHLVAAESETQLRLASIWMDLFKLSEIGIHDNFFELGGHSLLAVQAVATIRDKFDVGLSIEKFLELGTIEKIATHIDALTWVKSDAEQELADDETREEFDL